MSYIEGVDYWVRYREFPCTTIYAWAVSLGDGTFDIWLNTRVSEEKQLDGLRHDLKHLEDNHFFRDDLTLAEKEAIAWGAAEEEIEKQKSIPVSRILPGSKQYSVFRSNSLPEDVTFGFYVPDNSLRPALKKGQLVYCDDQQLVPGDIGLFLYHGETMCRQYHKDMFGMTYLFTLDRRQSRLDIVLRSCEEKDLICLGRVRAEKRMPLPGMS